MREDLSRVVARRHLPFAVTIEIRDEHRDRLTALMPFLAAMQPSSGAAAYLCRGFTCQAPVSVQLQMRIYGVHYQDN